MFFVFFSVKNVQFWLRERRAPRDGRATVDAASGQSWDAAGGGQPVRAVQDELLRAARGQDRAGPGPFAGQGQTGQPDHLQSGRQPGPEAQEHGRLPHLRRLRRRYRLLFLLACSTNWESNMFFVGSAPFRPASGVQRPTSAADGAAAAAPAALDVPPPIRAAAAPCVE